MVKEKVGDLEFINKATDKLISIWRDLDEWCSDNCEHECNCKDFAGACAIQTLKSVANWGSRVMAQEVESKKKIKKSIHC